MSLDFSLSPEQLQLQANAHAFAEGVLAPIPGQLDAIADPAEAFYATRAAYRETSETLPCSVPASAGSSARNRGRRCKNAKVWFAGDFGTANMSATWSRAADQSR
jgi:hypothetical protein